MATHLLTVAEVADRLRVTPRTVYRLVAEHRLTFIRVGNQLRFPSDDFEAYLTAGRVEAVR